MTPADRLRAMAEEEEKRADELEDSLPAIRAAIEAHRAGAAGMRKLAAEMDASLSVTAASSSMLSSKMELQNAGTKKKNVRIAAKMTEQDTEARKALFAANLTPQDIAAELGVGRSTVNAWCTGSRSIPKRYRDRLKARYKISTSVWPNQAD